MTTFSVRARADLAEIVAFYLAENVATGQKVLESINMAIEMLDAHPRIGAKIEPTDDNYRYHLTKDRKYRVYYEVKPGNNVLVKAVQHSKRQKLTLAQLKKLK